MGDEVGEGLFSIWERLRFKRALDFLPASILLSVRIVLIPWDG